MTRQGKWYGRKFFPLLSPIYRGVKFEMENIGLLRSSGSWIEKPVDHLDPSQRMMEENIENRMCSIWVRIRITKSWRGGSWVTCAKFLFFLIFSFTESFEIRWFSLCIYIQYYTHIHKITLFPCNSHSHFFLLMRCLVGTRETEKYSYRNGWNIIKRKMNNNNNKNKKVIKIK